jgi:hypothetical protein
VLLVELGSRRRVQALEVAQLAQRVVQLDWHQSGEQLLVAGAEGAVLTVAFAGV